MAVTRLALLSLFIDRHSSHRPPVRLLQQFCLGGFEAVHALWVTTGPSCWTMLCIAQRASFIIVSKSFACARSICFWQDFGERSMHRHLHHSEGDSATTLDQNICDKHLLPQLLILPNHRVQRNKHLWRKCRAM